MKPPKRAIIKAHGLADQLLASWQTDVRPWYAATEDASERWPVEDIDAEIHAVAAVFRDLRREVEQDDLRQS